VTSIGAAMRHGELEYLARDPFGLAGRFRRLFVDVQEQAQNFLRRYFTYRAFPQHGQKVRFQYPDRILMAGRGQFGLLLGVPLAREFLESLCLEGFRLYGLRPLGLLPFHRVSAVGEFSLEGVFQLSGVREADNRIFAQPGALFLPIHPITQNPAFRPAFFYKEEESVSVGDGIFLFSRLRVPYRQFRQCHSKIPLDRLPPDKRGCGA
jgi:hypothetical protein